MLAHQASRDRRIRQMVPVDTFDVIVSTNQPQYIPRTRKPTLQYCHFPHDPYYCSDSFLKRTYFALPSRSFHRRVEEVTKFIANSDFTRQAIFNRWGKSSLTIYPPCDLFQSYPGIRQDLVITVGRISPEKRFERMFEIARKIQWAPFEITGTSNVEQIASSERYYNQLLADKPENTEVKMNVSRSVLRDEFARAKIYLHLMENEHFGISIVEAMSSGCVPVVHKSGGPLEIVTSECGYFWETAHQAAAQIADVLSNEDLRKVRGKAAEGAKYFDARLFEERISRVVTDLSG
jgi:alpha-1,2-mannosyltransferase